jgi:hypothetical protein
MDREISRRVFLERAALLSGFVMTATAGLDAQPSATNRGPYPIEPAALLTVAAMAAQIIPTDQTPGANEAKVVDYIQKMVEASDRLQRLYVGGVKDLDARSQREFGAPFAKLDAEKEVAILKAVESSEFFKSVRNLTVRGYYSSAVGWAAVGYPGHGQPHGHRDFDQPPKVDEKPRANVAGNDEIIVAQSDSYPEGW